MGTTPPVTTVLIFKTETAAISAISTAISDIKQRLGHSGSLIKSGNGVSKVASHAKTSSLSIKRSRNYLILSGKPHAITRLEGLFTDEFVSVITTPTFGQIAVSIKVPAARISLGAVCFLYPTVGVFVHSLAPRKILFKRGPGTTEKHVTIQFILDNAADMILRTPAFQQFITKMASVPDPILLDDLTKRMLGYVPFSND